MRWIGWIIGYTLILMAVSVTMFKMRSWAIHQLATPQAVADWQTWRDDVQQLQHPPGPVQRRVPKSGEPPALVMLRDHFFVSIAGAVLFSSMLYWVFALFVIGALKGEPSSPPQAPR